MKQPIIALAMIQTASLISALAAHDAFPIRIRVALIVMSVLMLVAGVGLAVWAFVCMV